MIIRFENLDYPSYSAEFVFDSAGFERAQYDLNDFISVDSFIDPLMHKIAYNLISNDFVFKFHNRPDIFHTGFDVWSSFEILDSSGSTGIRRFNYENYIPDSSSNYCLCRAYKSLIDDDIINSSCYNYTVSDRITDSFTSSKYQYFNIFYDEISSSGTHHIDRTSLYVYTSNDCYSDYFPSIGFVENDINYPKFKIFAYDFNNFESNDCKYSLFLHFIDENIYDILKTLKVGSFGVYQGNFYFENFYGNKVFLYNLNKRYFDFYDFFNTNTLDNVSDLLKDNYSDFAVIDINSFGMPFVFELKKEDYSGVYMSTLDCECLNNAISGLSDEIKIFNKSFSEAFNKLPVHAVDISNYGVGSVFKSNDNVDIDFYHQFTNVFTGYCGDLFGVAFSKTFLDTTTCNHSVFKTSYIIDDEVGLNDSLTYIMTEPYSMGRRSVFVDKNDISVFKNLCLDGLNTSFTKTFLSGDNCDKTVFRTNLGIDFADSFSSAFNRLSGIGSVFANTDLVNQRTFYDEFLESFKSDCDVYFSDMFAEAFNLSNCLGSVFKANDNIWNDEDTLAGIFYKQLDKSYVLNNSYTDSAFWAGYRPADGVLRYESIPRILAGAFFKNNSSRSFIDSVFMWKGNYPFTDILKLAFFVGSETEYPLFLKSVFGWGSSDDFKILNHACNVNPNSIKFCEDVPFDFSGLPVPQVTVNNNVPVPDVDVDNNITVSPSSLEFSWDGFVNSFANPFFRLFQSDNDSFLNVLKNALFCQFSNNGVKRYNWENSVFKKLLYSEDAENCSDKVGLPELDLFVAPDNIYINSDGKPTRYTVDEVFK